MKPKGVTTQMKALNEYFPMVTDVHNFLLNRVHVFAMLICTEKHGSGRVTGI